MELDRCDAPTAVREALDRAVVEVPMADAIPRGSQRGPVDDLDLVVVGTDVDAARLGLERDSDRHEAAVGAAQGGLESDGAAPAEGPGDLLRHGGPGRAGREVGVPAGDREHHTVALEGSVDAARLRQRSFKVVLDYSFGAASSVMPNVLPKIGASVLAVNPFAATAGASKPAS